jgi:ABC-type bacteriocin/lantibiotic exporter with double-glycine peptidase domain
MINILPYQQSDASRCGPAVIKMVLMYYGIDATENDIILKCGTYTYENGCDDHAMKKAFESYGVSIEIVNNSTLEDIEYWMKWKVPIIVDWFSGGVDANYEDVPNGHSGIVVDIDREKIYILDPEFALVRCIPRNDFERVWFDWREKLISPDSSNLVIRQILVPHPNRFNYKN